MQCAARAQAQSEAAKTSRAQDIENRRGATNGMADMMPDNMALVGTEKCEPAMIKSS